VEVLPARWLMSVALLWVGPVQNTLPDRSTSRAGSGLLGPTITLVTPAAVVNSSEDTSPRTSAFVP
jgi:hypothetical protein